MTRRAAVANLGAFMSSPEPDLVVARPKPRWVEAGRWAVWAAAPAAALSLWRLRHLWPGSAEGSAGSGSAVETWTTLALAALVSALPYALLALVVARLGRGRNRCLRALGIAAAWVALDQLRHLGELPLFLPPFPLGALLPAPCPLGVNADLFGVDGLSFLMVFTMAAAASAFRAPKRWQSWAPLLAAGLAAAGLCLRGSAKIRAAAEGDFKTIWLALIQCDPADLSAADALAARLLAASRPPMTDAPLVLREFAPSFDGPSGRQSFAAPGKPLPVFRFAVLPADPSCAEVAARRSCEKWMEILLATGGPARLMSPQELARLDAATAIACGRWLARVSRRAGAALYDPLGATRFSMDPEIEGASWCHAALREETTAFVRGGYLLGPFCAVFAFAALGGVTYRSARSRSLSSPARA